MNYIYDILLDFNEKYYDFYEWDDNVIHVKKIPSIKVSDEQMKVIFDNKVKIELNNIFNKTEVFNNKNINACIIYCSKFAIGIKIDKTGLVIERSSLLFDDLEDILESDNEITNLNIEIIEKLNEKLLIKEDDYINSFINKEIEKLIKNKEFSKLKYIYYECFNYKEEKIEKVIDKLNKVVKNNYFDYGNKIYNILKLTI